MPYRQRHHGQFRHSVHLVRARLVLRQRYEQQKHASAFTRVLDPESPSLQLFLLFDVFFPLATLVSNALSARNSILRFNMSVRVLNSMWTSVSSQVSLAGRGPCVSGR